MGFGRNLGGARESDVKVEVVVTPERGKVRESEWIVTVFPLMRLKRV